MRALDAEGEESVDGSPAAAPVPPPPADAARARCVLLERHLRACLCRLEVGHAKERLYDELAAERDALRLALAGARSQAQEQELEAAALRAAAARAEALGSENARLRAAVDAAVSSRVAAQAELAVVRVARDAAAGAAQAALDAAAAASESARQAAECRADTRRAAETRVTALHAELQRCSQQAVHAKQQQEAAARRTALVEEEREELSARCAVMQRELTDARADAAQHEALEAGLEAEVLLAEARAPDAASDARLLAAAVPPGARGALAASLRRRTAAALDAGRRRVRAEGERDAAEARCTHLARALALAEQRGECAQQPQRYLVTRLTAAEEEAQGWRAQAAHSAAQAHGLRADLARLLQSRQSLDAALGEALTQTMQPKHALRAR
jgi:hypothetical protein